MALDKNMLLKKIGQSLGSFIETPPNLDSKERKSFDAIKSAVMHDMHGSMETFIEILYNNPDIQRKIIEKHKERAKNKVSKILAPCDKLLSLPVETLKTILETPKEEIQKVYDAINELENVDITETDIMDIKNMSTVTEIMEEDELAYIQDEMADGEKY